LGLRLKLITVTQNISETIGNIPVHIGVRALKAVTYYTLLPLFIEWSKGYLLVIDNVRLRSKDWVEMIAPGQGDDSEDADAISNQFFVEKKGKSKGHPQFQRNKVLPVYIELIYKEYLKVMDHLEELESAPVRT
jgi:hypothetical protein